MDHYCITVKSPIDFSHCDLLGKNTLLEVLIAAVTSKQTGKGHGASDNADHSPKMIPLVHPAIAGGWTATFPP